VTHAGDHEPQGREPRRLGIGRGGGHRAVAVGHGNEGSERRAADLQDLASAATAQRAHHLDGGRFGADCGERRGVLGRLDRQVARQPAPHEPVAHRGVGERDLPGPVEQHQRCRQLFQHRAQRGLDAIGGRDFRLFRAPGLHAFLFPAVRIEAARSSIGRQAIPAMTLAANV
jgi:hypothetical protein